VHVSASGPSPRSRRQPSVTALGQRQCKWCGAAYTPRRSDQKFCPGKKCAKASANKKRSKQEVVVVSLEDRSCDQCGASFSPRRKDQRFCPGGACGRAFHSGPASQKGRKAAPRERKALSAARGASPKGKPSPVELLELAGFRCRSIAVPSGCMLFVEDPS